MMTDDPTPRRIRRSRGLRATLAVGVGLVASVACHDSPVGPLASVTTVATVPSLSLAGPLPELPELVAGGGAADAAVMEAVEAWNSSWDEPDGAELRRPARAVVAAHLATVLDARGIEEAFRPLLWLETEIGALEGLPPALVVPLERAQRLTLESREARQAGELPVAVERALEAADQYRSVTPEAVARGLVVRAERRLADAATEATVEPTGAVPEARDSTGSATDPVPIDASTLDRAEHLVGGARRALDEGEFPQAIQRAFYAIQVLDGRMVDPEI